MGSHSVRFGGQRNAGIIAEVGSELDVGAAILAATANRLIRDSSRQWGPVPLLLLSFSACDGVSIQALILVSSRSWTFRPSWRSILPFITILWINIKIATTMKKVKTYSSILNSFDLVAHSSCRLRLSEKTCSLG